MLRVKPQDEGIALDLLIPDELAYFEGHFDEIAVVPGVVQIHWAIHYARQYLGLNLKFSHMQAIKFKDLLLRGQRLELVLGFRNTDRRLEFVYRTGTSEFSSGRIYFHEDSL